MPEPKCRWCKDTRVVQLLTTVAPCTDCPPVRTAPPVITIKKLTLDVSAQEIARMWKDRR